MERIVNGFGQVTLRGKIKLKAATPMRCYNETLLVPAGTEVEYFGLEGRLHVVQFTTPKGTFSAIQYEK